ncbi:MAG: hypothetical protein ACLTX3_06610 [Lachnospiraceae bacterium]
MYTKFHEIELDQPTWAVALLTTVEQKETKSKQPFCVFTLQDGEKRSRQISGIRRKKM